MDVKYGINIWTVSYGTGERKIVGCSENGNMLSASRKSGEFLAYDV